jgi:hypothetical protein
MAKGRFLKNAERACAGKARYDSQAEAEAGSDYRYAAYRCPVCGAWHLTSRGAPETRPSTPTDPPHRPLGPLLAEALRTPEPKINASNLNDPKPIATELINPRPPAPSSPEPNQPLLARVIRADTRPFLLLNGALVRAARPSIPLALAENDLVEIRPQSHPPEILRRVSS